MEVIRLSSTRITQFLALLLLSVAFSSPVLAQGNAVPRTGKNKLQLLLIQSSAPTELGEQENLTIRLVNAGETAISLPEPMKLCANTLNGFLMVYKKVLSRSQYPETGRGCTADGFGRRDVLADAKKWKTLAPGDMYDITVPLLTAVSLNPDARYELRAKYYPPHLTTKELSTLDAHGISVVQQTAESQPIIVERRND